MAKLLLKTGAACCFALSVGHLACLGFLDEAFALYGIDATMNGIAAAYGTWTLYAITVLIALAFAVCGLYGLAAVGVAWLRWLPFVKLVVYSAATVFLLRGIWGMAMLAADFTTLELVSTLVATALGAFYLAGGIAAAAKK